MNILTKFGTMTPAPFMMPLIEKALIIRLGSVGDILLSTPLIRVFRQQYPGCRLDFLVKSEYADLVRHNPHLSSVIELPPGPFETVRSMRQSIRATGYDLMIDIHGNLRGRYLCTGHASVVRINKHSVARFILIGTGIDLYGKRPASVADRYLATVSSLGVKDDGGGLEIYLPDKVREQTRQRVSGSRTPFIGVAPGARHATKRWPIEGFVETALSLAREAGSDILLFGSPAETDHCAAIEEAVHARDPGIGMMNLAGTTTLLEAAAFMDHCRVVITNDSGLMHLAAARKRKLVALFGPTVRQFGFFPTGSEHVVVENNNLSCRPCSPHGTARCPKGHFLCMNGISSSQVIRAAQSLLNG